MSLFDLKKLATGIDDEIRQCARQSEKDVWRRFEAPPPEHGMLLAEKLAASLTTSSLQVKEVGMSPWRAAPAKYVPPSDRRLGRAGRSRRPRWMAACLATGDTMNALAGATGKLLENVSEPSMHRPMWRRDRMLITVQRPTIRHSGGR